MLSPVESQVKRQPKFSEATIEIVKYWYNRATKVKKIRSQVAGLMQQQMVEDNCEFCKRNWGLRSECVESIEDLFVRYLKENGYQKIEDIGKWQSYFYKNAVLRTICFSCSEEILENSKKDVKGKKEKKESMIKMKKVSFDSEWKKKVNARILRYWLDRARKNMIFKKKFDGD